MITTCCYLQYKRPIRVRFFYAGRWLEWMQLTNCINNHLVAIIDKICKKTIRVKRAERPIHGQFNWIGKKATNKQCRSLPCQIERCSMEISFSFTYQSISSETSTAVQYRTPSISQTIIHLQCCNLLSEIFRNKCLSIHIAI